MKVQVKGKKKEEWKVIKKCEKMKKGKTEEFKN